MNDPIKIIDDFVKSKPSAEWIVKESRMPWLELDINTPHNELINEIKQFSENLIPFCSNISKESETYQSRDAQAKRLQVDKCVKDWEFITLYGIGSNIVSRKEDYTSLNKINVSHKWTDAGNKCPLHKKIIEDTFILDNDITIMYAVLRPGGFCTPHTDADKDSDKKNVLTSLTLMTYNPSGSIFFFENWGKIPIKQGKMYLLNVAYYHATINNSNENRYHLMFRIQNRDKTFIDYFKDKDIISRSFLKSIENFNSHGL